MSRQRRIIFIDRDGVINVDPIGDYIKKWEDFRFEKNALKALQALQEIGLEIILISNQAGIGDGIFSEMALWDIHEKMLDVFEQNGIKILSSFYCLHGKNDGCKCRKPEIGLFQKAVRNISYDPKKTFFVGDKATDIEAGKRFGIRTLFVRTGHGKLDEPKLKGSLEPDFKADDLLAAIPILKKQT